MRRKSHPKLSLWQRVLFAVDRYDSLNGGIAMGGATSLTKELNGVGELIEYINVCKVELNHYLHDLPIREEMRKIEKVIKDFKDSRSFLKALFVGDHELEPHYEKLRHYSSQILLKGGYSVANSHFKNPTLAYQKLAEFEFKLKDYSNILAKSIKESLMRADQRKINAQKSHERKQFKLAQEEAERDRLKGLAAAHTGKSRRRAISVKQQLINQIKILPYCPYCGEDLGESPHADHIYPIAKGGLSTVDNMVYVCQPCNKRKSDKTLIEFIQSSMFYNLNDVIKNLTILRKKI